MKHLRYRVFFQMLIPTLCVYIALSSYAYGIFRNTYKSSMIERKNLEMLNISRVLSDWISARIRELMILAGSETFFEGGEEDYRDYLLQRKSSQSFDFEHIWFIAESGDFWNTGGDTGTMSRQNDFRRYFTGESLFMYHIPDTLHYPSKDSIVIFAVPVRDQEGVIGMVGGSVGLQELRRLLRNYAYEMFDEIGLIDLSQHDESELGGRVIVHSNEDLIGMSERIAYGGVHTTNARNREENVFVTTLINNWKLVGIIDSENLFFQLKAFLRFFMLITVVIIIVVSIMSIGISQLISHPILSLTDMVNKMLQGDFSHEITVKTSDELQSLAGAFNLLNKRNLQLRTDDRFSFLGRISSRMAHEIRHPLQVIQIAIQSMNEGNFRKMGEVISHEINNADMFVREILEIAKPNELSLEHYSMSRLLENVHQKIVMMGQEKGVVVDLFLDAPHDTFYFDVLKIEQVVMNILSNSLEVTGDGDRIEIRTANDPERRLIVTISDTGPGFDKSNIDRIFDPYFSTKENGTGLGLSICYQILAAHGAHIELGDNHPKGAVTRLTFSSRPG